MVSNLQKARTGIEAQIDAIHRSLSDESLGPERRSDLILKEESLHQKLEEILAKLEEKQEKLSVADRQLEALKGQLEDSGKRHEELKREIESATSDLSKLTVDRVGSEALWNVLSDFQKVRPHMAPEESAALDDSLLMDMSNRGMRIVTCAALLSMGMIDQATTFAQNCGGGGGNPGQGWGERPRGGREAVASSLPGSVTADDETGGKENQVLKR